MNILHYMCVLVLCVSVMVFINVQKAGVFRKVADRMITVIISHHQLHLPPNPSLPFLTLHQLSKRQMRRVES